MRLEFLVTDADRAYMANERQKLLNISDDPSAGFLRFHLTEYVEANGKFSPDLTEWLLERVPMAPHCYLVNRFEGTEVVVYYRGYDALPRFDLTVKKASSRRYWSAAWPDGSFDRMKTWTWPPLDRSRQLLAIISQTCIQPAAGLVTAIRQPESSSCWCFSCQDHWPYGE